MSVFFLKVVNMSISASWIVLAVLILRLLLKKAPKWIIVLLWGIVAVRLICPFSIESVMSLIPSAETINPEILVDNAPVIDSDFPVIDGIEKPVIDGIETPVIDGIENPVINGTDTPVDRDPVTPVPDTTPTNPVQTAIPVLSAVWLVGIAGMLAYTVISYFRVKGKIGTAIRLRDNIFQSERVVSPFVLGLIKPKIYLSFHMNGQDMEYVIAHENAHIRRKDHWWKPIGFLILTLHWFNPLLWLGYVLRCRDIELACDEKVIKELDFQQKADYSQALLNCSVNRRIIAACPLAFGEIGVKERVKSVLNYKKPAFWIIVVAIVASIVAAVCFLTDPVDQNTDETTQQTDPSDATDNTIPTTPNNGAQSDPAITFRVNSSRPEYTAVVNYSKENPGIAQSVTITDPAAKKDIQTISLSGNELFAEKVLYFADVTFDGNLDMLIPYQQSASAAYFQAYVWQESESQFVYAPQFENLPNFIIDKENNRILSTRTASQITSYSISYYDAVAKNFKPSHSLYWEPDTSSNQIYFVEQRYENGTAVTVKDCLVEKISDIDMYKSDSQIAEYFSSNSFWDLDSQKWKDQFYKPGATEGTKTAAQAYADFLNAYVTDTLALYFTKDIDNNGTEELFIHQNTTMEVYTYKGSVKKVGAEDFITGTLLLHHTNDKKYPGIVYATVGGGKNHFGYITIMDGALSVKQTFDDDYGMISGKKEDVFYTDDEELIAISQKAFEDLFCRIGYSVWEPKTTEDPYAIREITDERVVKSGDKKLFNNGQFTLRFPNSWKCFTASGEDNVDYYFRDSVMGEKCQLHIDVTFAYLYNGKERTQEEYLKSFSRSYENVVIDSVTKETIRGYTCTKVVYSYTEDNTKFIGILYDALIEGPRFYSFRVRYPAEEKETYEKVFAYVLESIQFITADNGSISSLPLKEAYDYAVKMYVAGPSSKYRDVGKLQIETGQIIEIDGKYYQSYVASNVDIRYIWISQAEFPDNNAALWDWYAVGSSQVYSLDLLGKVDEGRDEEPSRIVRETPHGQH